MDYTVDNGFIVQVWQPEIAGDSGLPVGPNAPPPPQEAVVSIGFERKTSHVISTATGDVVLPVHPTWNRHIVESFDMSVFDKNDTSFWTLSSFLAVLGVPSCLHRPVVDRLSRHGRWAREAERNLGRRWVPIHATVQFWTVHRTVVGGGGAGWLEEGVAEDGGCGMVPAEEEAVKGMLKRVRVRVGGEERSGDETTTLERSCRICFEEDIPVGSTVAMMPCAHVFHEECIVRWLKESHYCPLCRFALPTAT